MGIKDTTYASLFDKQDLPYVYRLAEEVRATHNQDLVNEFNNNLENKWNDHNPILEVGDKNIEILQVSKADDLVVTDGINWMINQILGTGVERWTFMGVGNSSTAPAIGNTILISELVPRVDMSLSGWREYAGSSLRFAGIFGETRASQTITEAAVFLGASGGFMLNRNMFSNNPITHTINANGYVISCVIEFVPVM